MNNGKFYLAYGSNLNLEQMSRRCPTAQIVGTTILRNWKLMFRGGNHSAVATIERETGSKVPVLVWKIQPQDELALDRYEGWPYLYRKETLRLTVGGHRLYAMAYIMNENRRPYGTPSDYYYDTIWTGYQSAGFDTWILEKAVMDSQEAVKMDEQVKEQILSIRNSGETNMLDTRMVQYIANREEFYELVVFIEEHSEEYMKFILTGTAGEV